MATIESPSRGFLAKLFARSGLARSYAPGMKCLPSGGRCPGQARDRGVDALKELVAAGSNHMSAREAAFRLEVSLEALESM